MRIALISDIHANLAALEATFKDISAQAVDRIVCLGDIVGYNANPAECVALIRDNGVFCVAGNHDLAVAGRITTRNFSKEAARSTAWTRERLTADDLKFLGRLPLKANIEDQLVVVHGALHPETGCESVRLDNAARRMLTFQALLAHPSGARICAFGHTHHAAVYELHGARIATRPEQDVHLRDDAYYLINPGTVGEPRARDHRSSYMVVDLAKRVVNLRHVAYQRALSFSANRAAPAPRFGLIALARKWRGLVEATTR